MFPYQKIHAKRPLFGKKAKLLNFVHLYFDIVLDLELRISDFAALGISTTVVSALQIHPFLQNKANFQKTQMDVTYCLTTNYEQRTMKYEIKNKANSKPIQSQFKPNFSQKYAKTNPIKANFERGKYSLINVKITATF